jgi:hypothetical protein
MRLELTDDMQLEITDDLMDVLVVADVARELRAEGFHDTAAQLEGAYERQTRLLAVAIAERKQILTGLVDCPEPLAELRSVLLLLQRWQDPWGIS